LLRRVKSRKRERSLELLPWEHLAMSSVYSRMEWKAQTTGTPGASRELLQPLDLDGNSTRSSRLPPLLL